MLQELEESCQRMNSPLSSLSAHSCISSSLTHSRWLAGWPKQISRLGTLFNRRWKSERHWSGSRDCSTTLDSCGTMRAITLAFPRATSLMTELNSSTRTTKPRSGNCCGCRRTGDLGHCRSSSGTCNRAFE